MLLHFVWERKTRNGRELWYSYLWTLYFFFFFWLLPKIIYYRSGKLNFSIGTANWVISGYIYVFTINADLSGWEGGPAKTIRATKNSKYITARSSARKKSVRAMRVGARNVRPGTATGNRDARSLFRQPSVSRARDGIRRCPYGPRGTIAATGIPGCACAPMFTQRRQSRSSGAHGDSAVTEFDA